MQLPVAVVADNFCVSTGADVTITGLVATYYGFQVVSDNQTDITLSAPGQGDRRETSTFDPRSDWAASRSSGGSVSTFSFMIQENNNGGIKYFPE